MKTRSKVKAGGYKWNHNQTCQPRKLSLKEGCMKLRSKVKAGGFRFNHSSSGVRPR